MNTLYVRVVVTFVCVLGVCLPSLARAASPSAPFSSLLAPLQLLLGGLLPADLFSDADSIQTITETMKKDTASCAAFRLQPQRSYTCLHDAAAALLNRFSFPDIITAAQDIPDCHDYMHAIAQGAYLEYGSLAKVYEQKEKQFVCFGAVYHGAVEGYLIAHKALANDMNSLSKVVLNACSDAIPDKQGMYLQCVHGVGHALMFITDNNLPKSLELCDQFNSDTERTSCYGGTFMENVPSSQLSPHVSQYASSTNPWYPCTRIGAAYQDSCYAFQLSAVTGSDASERIANMAHWCAKAPVAQQRACFKSFGSSVGAYIPSQKSRASECLSLTSEAFKAACIQGVVGFYDDRFSTLPDKISGALSFCAVLPDSYQQGCYADAGSIFGPLGTSVADALCAKAGVFATSCMDAARAAYRGP
jgi:hypothetical protein